MVVQARSRCWLNWKFVVFWMLVTHQVLASPLIPDPSPARGRGVHV